MKRETIAIHSGYDVEPTTEWDLAYALGLSGFSFFAGMVCVPTLPT